MEIKNKFEKFLIGLSSVFLLGLIVLGFKVQSDQKKLSEAQDSQANTDGVVEKQPIEQATVGSSTSANQSSEKVTETVPSASGSATNVASPTSSTKTTSTSTTSTTTTSVPAPAPAPKKTKTS